MRNFSTIGTGNVAVGATSTTQGSLTATTYTITLEGALANLVTAITASNDGLTGTGATISSTPSVPTIASTSAGRVVRSLQSLECPRQLSLFRTGNGRSVPPKPSVSGVTISPSSGVGTFQPQQTFATGSGPESVAVGDFNDDGDADLAVANSSSNTVSVMLSNGNGTFQPPQTFATGIDPVSVVVGDFNGDGKLDLAVANEGSNTVSVFLGNGDGTFLPQQTFATGSDPYALAVADFNGDGKLDLAVANAGSNTVSVLLNTTTVGATTASFAAQQTFAAGTDPESVAVGDFNGDNNTDLAVANAGSNTVSVL